MSNMDKYQRQGVEDGNNIRMLRAQRDQLREALEALVASCDDPKGRPLGSLGKARDALKATEE